MSKSQEHDRSSEEPAGKQRDGDGGGIVGTPPSTDKVTRDVGGASGGGHHAKAPDRDGDPGGGGGGTPPSTDPPRGG